MATTTYGSPYVQSSDLVSAWPTASLSVADRIDDVSFKGNGLNNQTASYTGVLTDAGKTVMMNVATANTFTIPASGAVAYELGTVLRVSNKGAGTTTVQPNGGVVLNGGNIALTQYQSCEVQLVAADIWVATVKPSVATPSGLTLITTSTFSAVSSVSINNCFSATYDNYFISLNISAFSATTDLLMRLRAGGTDATGATDYTRQVMVSFSSTVAAATAASSSWQIGGSYTSLPIYSGKINLDNPFLAAKTHATNQVIYTTAAPTWQTVRDGFSHNQTTSYDGATIYPSSGTITGVARIYGYQNS